MATLNSPGAQVTVIDESFYTPAEPGTVPLIVVATGQNKTNGAGTGTASATTKANAGKAFKITSQRDLVDNYGVPFFEKTVSGTPVHGSERNEYGLLSAYSLLGVSNAAFIVRADIDLSELAGQTTAPGANPDNGDWWLDTANTAWGIFEWNGNAASTTGGQKFATKTPIVLTSDDAINVEDSVTYGRAPKSSVGVPGDYAVVAEMNESYDASKESVKVFYKRDSTLLGGDAWVLVGSPAWAASHATVKGTVTSPSITAGQTFLINGVTVTATGTDATSLVQAINALNINGVTAAKVFDRVYLYTDATNDDNVGDSALSNAIVIASGGGNPGTILASVGFTAGTYYGPRLQMSPHTQVPEFRLDDTNPRPSGSVWIKTTEPNIGSRWRLKQWSSGTSLWTAKDAPLYETTHAAIYNLDRAGGGTNIPVDSVFVQYNSTEDFGYDNTPQTATFRVWRRKVTGQTRVVSIPVIANTFTAGTNTFTIREMVKGQLALDTAKTVTFTAQATVSDSDRLATAINALGLTQVEASVTSANEVAIVHKTGGDIRFTDGTNTPLQKIFTAFNLSALTGTANLYSLVGIGTGGTFLATNWLPLLNAANDFKSKRSAPLNEPNDGQLWFNPSFGDVDIMVHNGTIWKGYKSVFPNTDPAGPIVAASKPTTQSDGTALVDNDLWISTADAENFPTIYRYNDNTKEWALVDKTDDQSEEGVVFADARYGSSGATGNTAASIVTLLTNDFVDPDCVDPANYPRGILLYNTRRSSGNVKKYRNNYIDTTKDNTRYLGQSMAGYATDRWVTASGNQEDGSGTFGRIAQRQVVVQALKAAIDTSQEIRDEERRNFNLISCPGYPEVLSNLNNLNLDRGVTSFVLGDSPLRLTADATSLTNWGTNANGALDNGDKGLVSYDEYCAVWYPNGFTTDLSGTNAVVPASHMMLRTIALSDQVSYPWFAPAGTRRGGITNATAVGYIDAATGEFQQVALNEGQRDTLYDIKVNPIAFFNGVGHVAYGQKTRARNASALDRINVSRLVVYLRSQLSKLARPYVFEPNDKITRDEIKQACDSLLLELVGLRAIYDFAVVCDESNNTPTRIDRNELYVDIAIEPVKAIEFIYIPLRIKNTGEI
jgi:hypothetical protein